MRWSEQSSVVCRSSSPLLLLRWLRRSVSRVSGAIRFDEVVGAVAVVGVDEGILVGNRWCRVLWRRTVDLRYRDVPCR